MGSTVEQMHLAGDIKEAVVGGGADLDGALHKI
jgi:hypothetical protein